MNQETQIGNVSVDCGKDKPVINNYLWQSIVVAICCFPMLGIAAIIFSAMSSSALGVGNLAKAAEHAQTAKKLCIIGACVGIALYLVFIIIFVFMVLLQIAMATTVTFLNNGHAS